MRIFRQRHVFTLAVLVTLVALAVASLAIVGSPLRAQSDFFQERCLDPTEPRNPYYAAALLSGDRNPLAGPSIVAFQDTVPNRIADRWPLASLEDTGSIFGLAYDPRRGHLYAGAFHQFGMPFGPGGTGGIYRIDLDTKALVEWVQIDAGEDHHGETLRAPRATIPDFDAIPWAGKVSLGDLEVDEAGDALYAVNLHDRRIHRFALPDALRAYVYRSLPDGGDMREVARLDLDYGTAPENWQPWVSEPLAERMPTPPFPRPDGGQPLLADIEMDRSGALALGLRNRVGDMYNPLYWGGDLLRAQSAGERFELGAQPEHYQDDTAWSQEPLRGGLAVDPQAERVLSAGFVSPDQRTAVLWAVRWFDRTTGEVRGPVDGREPLLDNESRGIGDLELLCEPAFVPTPWPSPSTTPSPSRTTPPTATSTASPSPSPTATSPLRPIYLPITMREHCPPILLDVLLALDMSTSMRRSDGSGLTKQQAALAGARALLSILRLGSGTQGDRAALLGFHDEAWLEVALTDDAALLDKALERLPARSAQGTRLDLALEAARDALPHSAPIGRRTVLLLLTDGLPNRVPTPVGGGRQEDTVLTAAQRLHAVGVLVYTLGLGRGQDLDEALLEDIAGSPLRYRRVEEGTALEAVFRGIAGELTCGR
jgi:hypothetical protein